VGAMKGVILSINPSAQIVDITHDIPPQDIEAGAFDVGHPSPEVTAVVVVVAGRLACGVAPVDTPHE